MSDNNDTSRPVPVNHPNFIPDPSQTGKFAKSFPLSTDNADVKSKPPSGVSGGHSDTAVKTKILRSVSHDGSNKNDAGDAKNRGSVGSFGSCDSKTYDEEVVISYKDEAVDTEGQGSGNCLSIVTIALIRHRHAKTLYT